MSRILLRMIFLTLFAMHASVEAQVLPEPVKEFPNDAAGFQQNISDLASPDYTRRQHAAVTLKNSSAEQIEQLGQVITSNPDNEVVRRVIEILEARYQQPDREAFGVAAASEVIESAAKSDRWFVAEASRDILKRHWKRRVELAVLELVRLGATLSPQDPVKLWDNTSDQDQLPFGFRNLEGTELLKIYIGRTWPKGPRSGTLLRRLESLGSELFLRDVGQIAIILVDGHTLNPEEIGELKGIFGEGPIQERGRVSLGIRSDNLSDEPGVTVRKVESGSSAETAGIIARDTIIAINNEAVADFDALVTLLRKFEVGDRITLSVIKYNGPERNKPVDVLVILKAWQ